MTFLPDGWLGRQSEEMRPNLDTIAIPPLNFYFFYFRLNMKIFHSIPNPPIVTIIYIRFKPRFFTYVCGHCLYVHLEDFELYRIPQSSNVNADFPPILARLHVFIRLLNLI
jgi:hypothetical protein